MLKHPEHPLDTPLILCVVLARLTVEQRKIFLYTGPRAFHKLMQSTGGSFESNDRVIQKLCEVIRYKFP